MKKMYYFIFSVNIKCLTFFFKKTIVELRLDMFHYASNNNKAVGILTTFAFLQHALRSI